MSIITDFIVESGLEIVEEQIHDAAAEKQVRERIESFLDKQQSLNLNVSLEEECDFSGLCEYIRSDLIDDVKQRCYGNSKERGLAHDRIMQNACSYASANTKLSARRVMKIVGTAIDILANYYRSRVNRELRFVTGEIEDIVKEEHEETRAKIDDLKTTIMDNSTLSIDKSLRQIDEGQYSEVERNLGTYMNALSAKHTLYPYFGYRMNHDNRLISVPLTNEAKKKYPESFRITSSNIKVGDIPAIHMGKQIFDQAYRHQLPIYIEIQNACKYLGDVQDPIQTEANEIIGGQAIMRPPAFPPAFPCQVCIGEEIVIPYLLMRTKEILDDGTWVITNEEQQNYSFAIVIHISRENKRLTFTVTPQNPTNKEFLKYRLFMKRLSCGESATLVALNHDDLIIRGTIDELKMEELDAEIDLLKKIVALEDFFKTTINIPETITNRDHAVINQIVDLINGGYKGKADKFDFSFSLTEKTRTKILEMKETNFVLAYSIEGSISLFNHEFEIPIIREIDCVRIDKLDHLKEKIRVLDVGDQVRMVYVPGEGREDCLYTDRINVESLETGILFSREYDPNICQQNDAEYRLDE